MTMFRKVATTFVALSIVAAPVAASAASAGARATSITSGGNELEGDSSWIIGLVGLLAGIAVIVLVLDDDKDSPVSP